MDRFEIVSEDTLGDKDVLIRSGEGQIWRYVASGIPNLYIQGGIEECSGKYEGWYKFSDLQLIHDLICDQFINKDAPLSRYEFRLIRKELTLQLSELSQILNVEFDELEKWETASENSFSINEADIKIRLLYKEWRETRIRPNIDEVYAKKTA